MVAARFGWVLACMVPALMALMTLAMIGRASALPTEMVLTVMGGGLAFSMLLAMLAPPPATKGKVARDAID